MSLHVVLNNGLNHSGVRQNDFAVNWYIDDTSARQAAYCVSIYEDKMCQNPVFESGKIQGTTFTYRYTGTQLACNHSYALLVTVWCDNGKVQHSDPLLFVTQTDEWKASWISCGDSSALSCCFSNFKKTFSIDKPISSAVVYTSFHTYGKLWINQQPVTGLVTPAPSHITKSKYYLCYDVTDLIKTGENAFAAQVYFINGKSQSFMRGLPGFIMQTFVYYEDGTSDCLISCTDWKASADTAYKNDTPFQVSRQLSTVQEYDFNHESVDWLSPTYSCSHWKQAQIAQIEQQQWNLTPQYVPEGVAYEEITPKSLAFQQPGVQVFDVGKIVSGWVRVFVKTPKPETISIRYAEDLDDNGRVLHKVANQFSEYYYDTFITKGGEECCFEADFSYKAFRYFEITGCSCVIDVENIRVISAGTDIACQGDFRCSNPLLNDIFQACIQTQQNNVLNMMTDCPHREQSQYVEDSNLQLETLLYNGNAFPLALKVLRDFTQAQLEDGTFPFVFPATFENDILKIPEWDLYYIEVLYKTYCFFGTMDILEQHYDTCRRILAHSLAKMKENGLVHCGDGWHIDDWPYPKNQETGMEFRTGENLLVYNNLIIISRIADVLGYVDESKHYADKAETLKAAIVRNLYDPSIKRFYDGSGTDHISQAINVSAYFYGVIPQDDRTDVLHYLATTPIECSVVMRQKLMTILFENGYEERAYELLSSEEHPGWGYMIQKGYKTMWEGFDDKESHSHAWNAYPARLMQEYLCGISLKEISQGVLHIKPYVPATLSYADGQVITAYGQVRVRWEKMEDTLVLTVSAPSALHFTVEAPKGYTLSKTSDNGHRFIFR